MLEGSICYGAVQIKVLCVQLCARLRKGTPPFWRLLFPKTLFESAFGKLKHVFV